MAFDLAPVLNQVTGLIEGSSRGRGAAMDSLRVLSKSSWPRANRPMDDPHVVLRIHGQTDGLPEHPAVGQRLGPERIDFELGACSPAAATTVRFPSHADPAPSATASVITAVPIHKFRFMADLALLDDRPPPSGRFGGLYIVFPSYTLSKSAYCRRVPGSSPSVHRGRRRSGALCRDVHAASRPIPEVVNVKVFVRLENGSLDLLVRVPLAAVKDIQFPTRGEAGYLDLEALASMLPGAADHWIAGGFEVFDHGEPVSRSEVDQTRIATMSDQSFDSYQSAIDHLGAPPLAATENRSTRSGSTCACDTA